MTAEMNNLHQPKQQARLEGLPAKRDWPTTTAEKAAARTLPRLCMLADARSPVHDAPKVLHSARGRLDDSACLTHVHRTLHVRVFVVCVGGGEGGTRKGLYYDIAIEDYGRHNQKDHRPCRAR